MAGKRRATSQINHDNWDDPEESEEAGTFTVASKDTLEKRVLKVAKRRVKSSNIEGNKPAFASFTGFKSADTPSNSSGITAPKPFGFFSGLSAKGTNGSKAPTAATESKKNLSAEEKYLSDLKQLNCSVTNWIKQHVDADPLCKLTPVFSDYEKYLKQIENERDSSNKMTDVDTTSAGKSLSFNLSSVESENKFKMTVPTSDSLSCVINSSTNELSKNTGKSPLSLTDHDKPKVPSLFSSYNCETKNVSSVFAKPDPSSLMINPFTSVLNKPVPNASSNNGLAAPTENKDQKNDEDEDESEEPPKVEFIPVQEEGSVYSTRCKVYVKKPVEKKYADRGCGTLFVKKVGDDKHQLLVRAETALGNILVNVLLSSGVPLQKMGKNNVMLVCLPTPQDPPPPTTVLLRVKDSDEAEELLATLEKYKN